MKQLLHLLNLILIASFATAQKVAWISSIQGREWVQEKPLTLSNNASLPTGITIYPLEKLQQMEGFGACFNEMGWDALQTLPEAQRSKILVNLFSKEESNYSLCRIPLGSNDYSLSYYSYNDVPNDFEMKNFNIDRDRYILIPYIKAARKIQPSLRIWASPWTPPVWMKVNNHYAMGPYKGSKSMDTGMKIANNATAFKMENDYLAAYALYFSCFVQAYQKEGLNISRILPQNEMVYQPHWQSCTWRPEDMAFYIGKFLGPQLQKDSLKTEIWLGTVNSGDPNFSRTILNNKEAVKFIKGVGMQWDAKNTIEAIHKEYPTVPLMQTESECGNGENNWKAAEYTWSLINRYISNGVSSYMYWNMVLDSTGISTWGWKQNMLISISPQTGVVKYNPEYYLMKHLSHFVLPGAYLLKTSGGKDHLAFQNPNGEIVVMLVNTDAREKVISMNADGKSISVTAKAHSINTIVLPPGSR